MPTEYYIKQSLESYEKLKNSNRPQRQTSEKEALAAFRKIKSERKEDFQKAISKSLAESLAGTQHAPLIPYLKISNGGYFSDEYEFLSYEKSVEYTNKFSNDLKKEELLNSVPSGIVFSSCANGDVVLLSQDGKIFRWSHEEPLAINEWSSLAQFFFDTINEY